MTEAQFKLKKAARLLELMGKCLGFIADNDAIKVRACMAEIKVVERTTYTEKGNENGRTSKNLD